MQLEVGQTTVIEKIELFLRELKLSIYSFCIAVCSIVKEVSKILFFANWTIFIKCYLKNKQTKLSNNKLILS